MPYLNGYDLVEALKGDPATWDIPVVFVTSDRQVEERSRVLRAEAYIKKPVKVDQLLQVVALFTSGPANTPKSGRSVQMILRLDQTRCR